MNTLSSSHISYSPRQIYVDVAKGIAICSVVLMHIYFGGFEDNHPLRALLGWSWHVAVFFLIEVSLLMLISLLRLSLLFLKR